MIGKRSEQERLFSYQVNLARRIPDSHPLKRIKQSIDFSFVREAVADRYGPNGHLSEDPEVILKLMFRLFFDHLASERELMRQLPDRLDYLWFLGFTLDDRVPDHSILSKARRRWGREVFESLFVRTVRQCVAAGLVEGSKLHFDGSLIQAHASPDSVLEGPPELIAALREADRTTAERRDEPEEEEEAGDDTDPDPPRGGYQKQNNRLLSTTDPEAPVIRRRGLAARPRYKTHRAVDNREGVITALATTPGDVEENRLLPALLAASEAHTGTAGAGGIWRKEVLPRAPISTD